MRLTAKFVAISAAAAIWILRSGEPAGPTAASGQVRPVWTKTDWPFAAARWGKGKAFRCKAEDCGGEVKLYYNSERVGLSCS
jgi:hypothetical protein